MNDLKPLGFTPFFEDQLEEGAIPARIASQLRHTYEVWSSDGMTQAELSLKLVKKAREDEVPAVGDWVQIDDTGAVIERLLERRTAFVRGGAGRRAHAQVVAANVDVVFVVCGLDADFNVRRIERYLARIYASGASPVVLLNKADLCDDVPVKLAAVQEVCIGAPVHVISAVDQDGLDQINAHLGTGLTAAFVGSSGAGKSTIINAVLGEERMATAAVRESDGRGMHTTTHRQLIAFPAGGLLIDTPGMRELQLIDDEGLDEVFADFEAVGAGCRFRDCKHGQEPGCAVKVAVAAGELSAERLEAYSKLQAEARANEIRHNPLLRKKAGREMSQKINEVKRMGKWKDGEE